MKDEGRRCAAKLNYRGLSEIFPDPRPPNPGPCSQRSGELFDTITLQDVSFFEIVEAT